jgi:hypothetical protein
VEGIVSEVFGDDVLLIGHHDGVPHG